MTQIRSERQNITKYKKQQQTLEDSILTYESNLKSIEQQIGPLLKLQQNTRKRDERKDISAKVKPLVAEKMKIQTDKANAVIQLDDIIKKISDLSSNEQEHIYLCTASKYLNEYCKIKSDFAAIIQLYDQGDIDKLELEMKRRLYLTEKNKLFREFEAEFFPESVANNPTTRNNTSLTGCKCNAGHCVTNNGIGFQCIKCKKEQIDYMQQTANNCSYDTLKTLNRSREYTYRRITHFRDLLHHIQGKSRSSIDLKINDLLRNEFKKCQIKPNRITQQLVRKKLKHLGLSEYYEHVTSLTQLLNPTFKILDIPPAREELLCYLFCQTEVPFEKIKRLIKTTRKNYMSYPFVAYKLCELKGWTEYMPYFSLLKSNKLLQDQDSYWYLVTQLIGWPFYNTVGNISRNLAISKNNEFAEIHDEIRIKNEKRDRVKKEREQQQQQPSDEMSNRKRTFQMVICNDNNSEFEVDEDDIPIFNPPDNDSLGYRANENYLD